MDRLEERAGPEDVGDQALMRGLDTALPFVRPGLSLSEIGRRSCDRPRSKLGSSPCRGPALASARLMFMMLRCYIISLLLPVRPAGLWAGRALHTSTVPYPRPTGPRCHEIPHP